MQFQLPPGTRLPQTDLPRFAQVPQPETKQPGEGAPRPIEEVPPVQNLPPRQPGTRLDNLPDPPAELRVPRVTPRIKEQYERFFQGTIDPENTLDLIVGRPRILVFKESPKRIYQPDEEILSHQLISETEISLVGKQPGRTVINFWVTDPQAPKGERVLSYLVNISPEPQHKERLDAVYKALEGEINKAFPNSRVELSLVGDQLVVRGQAKDAIESSQILSLLSRHSPRGGRDQSGQNVQLVQRTEIYQDRDPLWDEEQAAARTTVIDQQVLSRAGIVNLLEIPGEQQVMLRVTVAEVNRTALRSIGLNFSIQNNQGTTVFQNRTGNLLTATGSTGTLGGLANLPVNLDNGQISLAINALRNLKLARTLAEPNLTALNGHSANFQAGGRFPVPVVGGFTNRGLQGVAFVPFGVQLQFTPYIVDRDRIRLTVGAEVSTRDEALGASVGGSAAAGGTSVSGISTRNFNTTVELREGQTLAVGGLIQSNYGADSDRVPFWGDLPLIGHTGGFNRVSSGEQELVILITPELVHPLEACQTPPLPGNDVFEPTDVEFFLGNKLESRRTRDYRATVRTDYARIRAGDKFCEDQFIIGPAGPTYGCCKRCVLQPGSTPESLPSAAMPRPVIVSPEAVSPGNIHSP
jgi:pilus assembly protein CpaC